MTVHNNPNFEFTVQELIDWLKECNPDAKINPIDIAWTVGDFDEEDILKSKSKCSKVTIYSDEPIIRELFDD